MKNTIITFDPDYTDFGNFATVESVSSSEVVETELSIEEIGTTTECDVCIDIIKKYITSSEFLQPIKDYMNTSDYQTFVNNIIREILYFDSEYVFLDKTKIGQAIIDPTSNPLTIFSSMEVSELIKQANLLGFIDDLAKDLALNNLSLFPTFISAEDYNKLLQYQLNYLPIIKRYIPTIPELQENGLDPHVVTLVTDKFLEIISPTNEIVVTDIVDTYMDKIYMIHTFTPTQKIEYIYEYPRDFLKILTDTELHNLLERVRYYIDFLTPTLVDTIYSLTDQDNILDHISINEIKEIMDKEVDMKNAIIKAVTLKEITAWMEKLRYEFLSQDLTPIILQIIMDNLTLTELEALAIIKTAIIYAEEHKDTKLFGDTLWN